jgi:nitrite reductase (NADH) small subunit
MTAFADTETVTWIAVGAAADVPLWEGRSVTLEERKIAIFHTDAGFHAVDGVCPHLGGPLQDGIVADDCVTCPLHGRRFSLGSGAVIGGGPDDAGLHVYPVVVHDGELMVGLPDHEEGAGAAPGAP